MSIKPVDIQVMLPKTSELSKIYNDEQHKSQVLQQQQASSFQHKAEDNLKSVHSQSEAHEAKIKDKQEKNRQNRREEKEKKNDKENDGKKNSKPGIRTSTIDIRL